MIKNLDKEGLQSIADNYDLFFIDLWGVVHNGIELHEGAITTLKKLVELDKQFVLLTNAPRPIRNVKIILEKMGMEENLRNHIFTSGEASLSYLNKEHKSQKFYHVGPPRDFDLFQDFKKYKSDKIIDCEYLLCTGLFDEHDKDLNFYKDLLENFINKKMICTNPDLIVDKGNIRKLCAGSVAMVFEKMGGEVVYFGKPYPEVYNQSIDNKNKKILSIGDNLNTDIKGANLLNYDSLLISNGVHKNEIQNNGIETVSKKFESIVNFVQSDLKW